MTAHVVYIDDEAPLCRAFTLLLRREPGLAVTTFTDPDEALRFLAEKSIDLVFCDYRLPDTNALEMLESLSGTSPSYVGPFYVVSGDLDVVRDTGDHPRVTGVLTKPFRAERILEIVRAHVPPTE